MKKICVIGSFADKSCLLDGQTVKTKNVYKELKNTFGHNEISKIDTYGGLRSSIKIFLDVLKAVVGSKNIIILPAENGLRTIVPLLVTFNKVYKRKLYYIVIGGWLPAFVDKRNWLKKYINKIDCIFVETASMKEQLNLQGYTNIDIIPNFKALKILDENDITPTINKPYRLCTFSRVMKEKGIEDAITAVKTLNSMHGIDFVELDIYGQVDDRQKVWFEKLLMCMPPYIKYKGVVPFSTSTSVLYKYDALLFPTYYEGEGFAGTIIDAFAAGLPVIASDWKYNPEIIEPGRTGIIHETHNIESLINAISTIDSDVKKWNDMKRNCRLEATKYLPSVAMRKVIDLM